MPRDAQTSTEAPSLVLRFALYAGGALALAVVGALVLARFDAVSAAESDLREDAAYLAEELGRDDLALAAFAGPVTADVQAQLDDLLGLVAQARDVTRASLVDPDGTIVYSTAHELSGRPASVLGKGMLDERAPVRWVLEAGRARGVLVAERDDAAVAAEVRGAFLRQTALVVLALLALYGALIPVFRRVTAELGERHRRLAESEARYRSLMEQASDAIFVADRHGRLTDVNERACELLGYRRDELLERHAMDLLSIGDVAQLPLHMLDLEAGRTILVERPVRRKDGTHLVGDVSAKLLDDGRILTTIRDVTERKQLRVAQKAEAVGRFAGSVADELQLLLDAVGGHAESLRRRLGHDADVEGIRSVVDATRGLTDQLLAVGSKQELRPEVVDLNEALHALRPLLEELTGEAVTLVVEPGEQVDAVFTDPAQLEKVVVDLVLHARASMPHGGTLRIETANVEFAPNGRSRSSISGRRAMLAISDTGGAGDDDGADRLGLGLAAVYGIVHQSGGSIGVESEPGAGTTVRIYLPAATVAAVV